MRAPVSWIREYADLPADLSTEDLARKLTALGLKLESLERPGADISGPLVVGRVLTMEPEPQKNGKTINWCTVDVGAANGTGEAAGHRLRRPQLRARRPGRRRAARGCAARRLRDLGAQDLRPRLGRDDLLGARARASATTTTASSCSTRAPVQPGDDARAGARPRRGGHRVRDQPRPRLRAVPARRRARGGDGLRHGVHRPVPASGAGGDRRRLPGAGRGPGRAARSSWRAR